MRRVFFCLCLVLSATAVFPQNAYEKCVQQCVAAGGDMASCRFESCDQSDTAADVTPGNGNPLYLPSYQLKGPAPVIDGSLMSRDGDPSTSDALDEWKEACSRTLLLNDSTPLQLFLVNSPDTLYIGVTYLDINNSNGCGMRLLFDQGDNVPPSQYHGTGDLRLSAPNGTSNENGCSLYKAGGSYDLNDLCWNGTSWINDGDGARDFRGASSFFNTDNKVHHYEFAVPLHTSKANDATNSDLNVAFNDAIGFYAEVTRMGTLAGTYYWIETNGNPRRADTFPFWGKIQLSVDRNYFTFFPGRGHNPPPVIDGSISEAAWGGAYQRELVLSNYHYGSYRSRIWCLEDSAQNSIFIGMRIYDKTHNAQDYCQLYFEGDGASASSLSRNYILDNNAEGSVRITNSNQFSGRYWNMADGAWTANPSADSQAAKAGAASGYTDYEFKVFRAGGTYHANIARGGMLGFLIRYHDGDKISQEFSDYYWEYTTNNDAQLLDQQSHPYVYVATGWTNLQLGGPFLQVVRPAAADSLFGTVPLEVSSGGDSLKSVTCFLANDTAARVPLVYQGSGVWKGSLTIPSTGNPMLVVRAVTPAGLVYERVVNRVDQIAVVPRPTGKAQRTLGISVAAQSRATVEFLLNLPAGGGFSLDVYNAAGRRVWSRRAGGAAPGRRLLVRAGEMPFVNGTYLVSLAAGGERLVKRFVLFR